MSVYVLCVDGNPIHSFVASDDRIAAATVRDMINKTAYGYKGSAEILFERGYSIDNPPKIFDAVIEFFSVDIDGLGSVGVVPVRQVKDPLLDSKALDKLFFDCLPVHLLYDENGRLSHAVAEVKDNG